MTGHKLRARLLLCVLAAHLVMATGARAADDAPPQIGRQAARQFERAGQGFAVATRESLGQVVLDMTAFLDQRRWNEDERRAARQLRGQARALLGEDEAALEDLLAVVENEPATRRTAGLYTTIVDLSARTGRTAEAITLFEAQEPVLREVNWRDSVVAVVPAYVAERQPDRALALLRDGADVLEGRRGAELHAMRHAMALQMRRWAEAADALAAHEAAVPGGAPYIDAARARLTALRSEGEPDPADLRETARAFLNAEVNWRADNVDAQPILRVPPRGFEGCLSRARRDGAVEVEMEFDVDAEGIPRNVEVVGSDDGCFDRYAVASVKKWRYVPRLVDGQAFMRSGVRTKIIFHIPN